MVSSLTSALLGGESYSGVPVSEMQQNVAIISQTMNNPALSGHLSDLISANTDAAAPQAYLTYLVFDQNLQLIPPKSGMVQVPTGGSGGIDWTTITPELLEGEAITIDAPGYIIVYVNNNSIGKDVYFDNIKIEHYAGTLLEENHYYPYGLTVSQAASGATAPENPYKYNTKELETTFGLQSYDFGARMYNSQIGRWDGIDPLAIKGPQYSPYIYSFNNPIRFLDPDGKWPWSIQVNSFISARTTGGGLFYGDGRGPSFSGTSRVRSNFVVDPSKNMITKPNTQSDPTIFFGVPGQAPTIVDKGSPQASIGNIKFEEGTSTFDFNHTGKDPITPGFVTPALDVHAGLSFKEDIKNGILTITGSFAGDKFPSTEAYITDQSGKTKLFLGAQKENGGIRDLYGDNKENLFKVNMNVTFDKKGNMTGVQQGEKKYSITDWNKKVQEDFAK